MPTVQPDVVKPIDLPRLRSAIPQEIFHLPKLRSFLKAIFLATLLAGALVLGTNLDSLTLRIVLGLAMGPFLFGLTSLGHEAGHGTASRWRFLNDFTGILTMSALGIPARGWKVKHDLHHKYGGVPGADADLDPTVEEYMERGWLARRTARLLHEYEFLLWWATPISIWFTTWRYAILNLRTRGAAHLRRRRDWTIVDMIVGASFFVGAALYGWNFGWVNLGLLVGVPFAVSGVIAAVCFVPNHRGMPPLNEEQARRPARYAHLNARTVLYHPLVPANYFMNYVPWQIEHHVFPTIPGYRLSKLSPHLRDYAREEGIPLAYEKALDVMPRMLSRQWLWGARDGRSYTYREAEQMRLARKRDRDQNAAA